MSEIGLDQRLRPMPFPQLFLMPQWVIGLAYMVGYVLLDWISFLHPFAPFGITPWNPQTGLIFVLVLMFGQKFIPLLFAAPLLADLFVRHLPFPWTTEALLTAVTGAGYAAGLVVLLRPGTGFNPALTTM